MTMVAKRIAVHRLIHTGTGFRFLGISASEHIIEPRDATLSATPLWMVVRGDNGLGRMLKTASFRNKSKSGRVDWVRTALP